MKRLLNILVCLCLGSTAIAQEDTRIVDSLRSVLPTQEGREKVLIMIELTWEFYDISYDDCLNWGEKAIKEAHDLGFADLEAKSNYVLGIQYAYHGDLDLAKEYLKQAYSQFTALGDTKNTFESLWNLATYEMTLGSIDTAYAVYEDALSLAKQLNDTSAYAFVMSNMGLIWYRRANLEMSLRYNTEAKTLFEAIGDDQRVCRMQSNIAVIYMERGRYDEARKIYWNILPRFEAFGDNHYSFLACKNLGTIYENAFIDYDSALYYLQKAIDCGGRPMPYKENALFLGNEKSGAMVEMGNIMAKCGGYNDAIDTYNEALLLAENNAYHWGQMEACVGLINVYAQTGQAAKAMQYYQRYCKLEKASGITHMRSALSKPLIVTFARLDRFEEMSEELEALDELRTAQLRENADLYEQNDLLQGEVADLVQLHEAQNQQIQTLQTQRNHYRLAFFGLLAIALFTVVLLAAYKIVRKNRSKSA